MKIRMLTGFLYLGLIVGAAFAADADTLYEKAYFLETGKGETEAALKIYRELAARK